MHEPNTRRTRRRFIHPLTIRWLATRGWAWAGAFAFSYAAVFLRPASNQVPDWIPLLMFGLAGITLGWLAWIPESIPARCAAVGAVALAAVGRAVSILLVSTNDFGTQMAGTGIWLLVALWCWLLAVITFQVPSRLP